MGAKMVEFNGWDMPVEYPAPGGLIAEHMAVRASVGIFDVSHMGDIQLARSAGAGGRAADHHERRLEAGHWAGAVFGDAVSAGHVRGRRDRPSHGRGRLPAGDQCRHAREGFQLGPRQHAASSTARSRTSATTSPRSPSRGRTALRSCRNSPTSILSKVKFYWLTHGTVCGLKDIMIARTGYTAEDGFEIYVPSDEATSADGVERSAGGGQGIRDPGLRAGRAQYAAAGRQAAALRPRNLRHDQCLGSRARPLLQDGERRIHRTRGAGDSARARRLHGRWSAWR